EAQTHADGAATARQDLEQRAAREPREAVAGRGQGGAVVVDLDVVPAVARRRHGARHLGIGLRARLLRGVGEHHAEPEGVVGTVALVDGHVVARIGALDQRGEEQTGGAAAHARDLHARRRRSGEHGELIGPRSYHARAERLQCAPLEPQEVLMTKDSRLRTIAALALLALPLAAGSVRARDQAKSAADQVRALEVARGEALIKADTAAIARMTADEFVEISRLGQLRTKGDNLRDVGSGTLKITSVKQDSVSVQV